jgi:hypothetical protein
MELKFLVVILAFVLFSPFVFSESLMALQGNVFEGEFALLNGDLRVEIYDSASGGSLIYNSSADFDGAINEGKYDVLLGSGVQKLNLNYGEVYYLELYINDEKFNFSGEGRQRFQSSFGNVSSLLVNWDGNVAMGNYNLSAKYFIGNGSLLTGVVLEQYNDSWINSSFYNKTEILGFDYYNSSKINASELEQQADGRLGILDSFIEFLIDSRVTKDFVKLLGFYEKLEVYNKSEVLEFDYYNLSDFNISNYARLEGANFTGETNFGGDFLSGGVTITGGDIFAQNLYVYNITSLEVTHLNVNGSIIPQLDSVFDIGSSERRYKNFYFSGDGIVNGTVLINGVNVSVWLYNQTTSAINYVDGVLLNYYNKTYLDANLSEIYNQISLIEAGNYDDGWINDTFVPYQNATADLNLSDYTLFAGYGSSFGNENSSVVFEDFFWETDELIFNIPYIQSYPYSNDSDSFPMPLFTSINTGLFLISNITDFNESYSAMAIIPEYDNESDIDIMTFISFIDYFGGGRGSEFYFEGDIFADNLNIDNWDEAYLWGNHSDAGYLNETDILVYLGDYYNKTEVDDLFDSMDLTDYYNKTEVYNKSEVDDLISGIVTGDYDDGWINLTFYNKTYLDGLLHGAVTLAGQNYLSLAGQQITANPINLSTAHITGRLPFSNLTQGSGLSVLGVSGSSTADFASIAAGSDYQVLRRSGTSIGFGAINLSSSNAVTGTLPIARGGTGATGFNTGQVLFGNFSQSSGLFWNDTSGRLGVNTSSPTHTLNVFGGANITGGLVVENLANDAVTGRGILSGVTGYTLLSGYTTSGSLGHFLGYGVYGSQGNGTYAGYFSGDVGVTGRTTTNRLQVTNNISASSLHITQNITQPNNSRHYFGNSNQAEIYYNSTTGSLVIKVS